MHSEHRWRLTSVLTSVLACAGLFVFGAKRAQAQAWTLSKKTAVVQTGLFYQASETTFNEQGDRARFPNGSMNRLRGALFNAAYGVFDPLTAYGSFALIDFDLIGSGISQSGPSDTIGGLKWNVWQKGRWAASLYMQAKFPTAKVTQDASSNLGEKQFDWEGGPSVGALWPGHWGYSNLEFAYRRRFARSNGLRPGDEIPFRVDNVLTLPFKKSPYVGLTFDGFYGFAPETSAGGIRIKDPTFKRRQFNLSPRAGVQLLGKSGVDFGVQLPLAGRQYSDAVRYTLGFAYLFGTPKVVQGATTPQLNIAPACIH